MTQATIYRNPMNGSTVSYAEAQAYNSIVNVMEVIQEQCADIKTELEMIFPRTDISVSVEITTESYGYRVIVETTYRKYNALIPITPGQKVLDVCRDVLKTM